MDARGLLADKELVADFTQRLTRRFGDRIARAIFFGSRARGLASPASDYDLLLVLREKDRGLVEQVYDEALEFLLTTGQDLSLKIYTAKAFQAGLARRSPFLVSVVATGIELWSAPPRP
jgi:predicted nucleotidyltransferase